MTIKLQILYPLLLLYLTTSCSHSGETIFTKINANGTCFREITAQADSAFMVGDTAHNNPFSIKPDSSWELSWQFGDNTKHYNWPVKEWKPDTSLKNKHVWVTLKKHFESVAKLSSSFRFNDGNWDSIHSEVNLNKHFRWFVTYFDYAETFPKLKNIEKYPVSNFLTKDEILLYFQGGSNLLNGLNGIEMKDLLENIEKRKDNWLFRNIFEIQYNIICKNLNLIKGKPFTLVLLTLAKDSILKSYQDSGYKANDDVYLKLDTYFKTKQFSELCEKNEKVVTEFKKSSEFSSYFQNEFNYRLLMPGKVISSNGVRLQNDTLSWKIDAYRFALIDYTMKATSRVVNIWAILITILILAVLSVKLFKIYENKYKV